MGGIGTSVIMLAEAMARLGHRVTILNGRQDADLYEGVDYRPYDQGGRLHADLIISQSSAKPLMRVRKGIPVVWQHNRTKLSRIWKRGEFFGLLLKRPHLVCLSNDARQQTPKWIPYRSLHVIPHAIEPMFLQADVPRFAERRQRVFFASRASRNLKWVIEVWKQYIHPVLPDAEFVVCVPPSSPFPFDAEALAAHNILYKGSLPKDELADLINTCKALVYPGHINETGCQVALQAIGLGVPIVSCGHGSLKDLVQHDVTGFIEMDMQAYAARVIQCLTDEDLWCRLHRASLQHPWRKSYDERALDWQKTFLQQ